MIANTIPAVMRAKSPLVANRNCNANSNKFLSANVTGSDNASGYNRQYNYKHMLVIKYKNVYVPNVVQLKK